jgi:uncharacterized membrane protein YkvA (DUF1232 family)
MRQPLFWLAVAVGVWAAAVVALVVIGRRTPARELAFLLPNLIRLFKGLAQDPRVPRSTKVLVVLGLAWFASPIDLLPEFLPVVGPLDDAVVAWLILRRVVRTSGRDVLADHWHGSDELFARGLRALKLEDT